MLLGRALTRVHRTPSPAEEKIDLHGVDIPRIRNIIDQCERGYLAPKTIQSLLSAAHIPYVKEGVGTTREEIRTLASEAGYPVVMKVVGPLHKSDVGGVTLNIKSEEHLLAEFERTMRIPEASAVMVQPMLSGTELFLGARVRAQVRPRGALWAGRHLRGSARGRLLGPGAPDLRRSLFHDPVPEELQDHQGRPRQEGVSEKKLAEIIVHLSTLLRFATEIKELDLNPLLGTPTSVTAVDARFRVG